jgi:hypothetical protein
VAKLKWQQNDKGLRNNSFELRVGFLGALLFQAANADFPRQKRRELDAGPVAHRQRAGR